MLYYQYQASWDYNVCSNDVSIVSIIKVNVFLFGLWLEFRNGTTTLFSRQRDFEAEFKMKTSGSKPIKTLQGLDNKSSFFHIGEGLLEANYMRLNGLVNFVISGN